MYSRPISGYLIVAACFATLPLLNYYYSGILLLNLHPATWSNASTQSTPVILRDDDKPIADQIDRLVSEHLCNVNNMPPLSCKFEQRHLPPFAVSLPSYAAETFGKLRKSTLLVVVFNRDTTYYTAPLVHALYARAFRKVFYCGKSANSSLFTAQIENYFPENISQQLAASYLSYKTPKEETVVNAGETVYNCFNLALAAVERQMPISGVFVLHDDVLLSYWRFVFKPDLFDLSVSHSMPIGSKAPFYPYSVENLRSCQLDAKMEPTKHGDAEDCLLRNTWPNWPRLYKANSIAFWKDFDTLGNRSWHYAGTYAQCLLNITRRTGGKFRVFPGMADMFYIAQRDFRAATAMFSLAAKHQLFQEITVPTTFACFDPQTTGVIDSSGVNNDAINRKTPWEAYDANRLVMHPFKLSRLVSLLSYSRQLVNDSSRTDLIEEIRSSIEPDVCLYCSLSLFSKMLALNYEKN